MIPISVARSIGSTPRPPRRLHTARTASVLAFGFALAALAHPLLRTEPLLGAWALSWLVLVGAALLVRRPSPDPTDASEAAAAPVRWHPAAVVVFCVGFAACALLASRSAALVPAMHDEWSYLFQAKTWLAGRFWLPSRNEVPGLFDQIHVLNEGRFASRYFPGTGLWLAPFVALGHPHLGQWLAAGLAAALVFETGRRVGGTRAGWIAGLLVALAPGVADFCNLLVAHAPTLLGLSLFLCAFARADRETTSPGRQTVGWLAAGAGLAFAMLCRPLTAAAVGLPFGLALLAGAVRSLRASGRAIPALRPLVATGAPIVAGLLLLMAHDAAITGSPWKTPYGLYNDLYTPRHVYGFDNGVRGDAAPAPKRDVDYDRWARNLTPEAAARNARARLGSSLNASIGAIPLTIALATLLLDPRRRDRFGLLCIASIASLHAAYVPYWFVGINAYHYVFESIPLYALVFAAASARVDAWGRRTGRLAVGPAFASLALVPAIVQWIPFEAPMQTEAGRALRKGTSFEPARAQAAEFSQRVEQVVTRLPALVLVQQPATNFHFDPVVNDPNLDAPILFGRYHPGRMSIEAIHRAFPDRALYVHAERRGRPPRFELVAPRDRGSAPEAWTKADDVGHSSPPAPPVQESR